MARDERFPDEVGVDRRTFMKAAVAVGAAGLAGSLIASGKTLLPPTAAQEGTVNEGFIIAKGDTPNPYGFDALAGQEARVEHFTRPWAGVAAIWRAVLDDQNAQIPGTGFPVLLIRVDPELFRAPSEWVAGQDYIEATIGGEDATLVAIWDKCVHLCCFPQWHLAKLPPSYQVYDAGRVPRTFTDGQDPIWCRCHNSQYDPVTIVWDVHPSGIVYLGANMAHGPAKRGLPAVSIASQGGKILGTKFTSAVPTAPDPVVGALGGRRGSVYRDWYFAYCR